MACCQSCNQSRFGCGGQGCSRTGGILSDLTVTAADTGGKRLAKELGMFALLTSPAWVLLLLLPRKSP